MTSLRHRFGDRLRDLRLEKRLTQDEFAELVGVSSNFLSMIERGINSPSFDKLDTISSKLGMTLSELFDFPEQPGTRKRAKKPRNRKRKMDGEGTSVQAEPRRKKRTKRDPN